MINLDQTVTKGFPTVWVSFELTEQHSENRGILNVQKYVFFSTLKFTSLMDVHGRIVELQLQGASLHLEKVSCTWIRILRSCWNKWFPYIL